MSFGESNRHFGETRMNERSSRSHCVLTVIVQSQNKLTGTFNFCGRGGEGWGAFVLHWTGHDYLFLAPLFWSFSYCGGLEFPLPFFPSLEIFKMHFKTITTYFTMHHHHIIKHIYN